MCAYKVPRDLLQRYAFCGDKTKLFQRVVSHIAPNHNDAGAMYEAMVEERFIPAGNTLVAGVQPLMPNCAILGSVDEENYREKLQLFIKLLSVAIGCGIDLTHCHDPVAMLRHFAGAAQQVRLGWTRPLRGNMATLSINHHKFDEFIHCKSAAAGADPARAALSIFNLSISVPDYVMIHAKRPGYSSNRLQKLCEAAHRSGDPGVIFIDKVQSRYEHLEGRIVTSVPCGEQFMFDGETCTLGAINLDQFVINDRFDYDSYRQTIHTAMTFLDLVIDRTMIPDDAMREKTMAFRRIGLGVMGLATLFDRLQIRYESQEALDLSAQLAACLTEEASRASQLLGQERGYHRHSTRRRHISTTCLQPTGGIRRLVASDGFSIEPRFDEATRISPQFSVRMAATWQQYIENAVSKTVNLDAHATVDDVRSIYEAAFIHGCKGITVYRDGCKENQPISLSRCHDGECRE